MNMLIWREGDRNVAIKCPYQINELPELLLFIVLRHNTVQYTITCPNSTETYINHYAKLDKCKSLTLFEPILIRMSWQKVTRRGKLAVEPLVIYRYRYWKMAAFLFCFLYTFYFLSSPTRLLSKVCALLQISSIIAANMSFLMTTLDRQNIEDLVSAIRCTVLCKIVITVVSCLLHTELIVIPYLP